MENAGVPLEKLSELNDGKLRKTVTDLVNSRNEYRNEFNDVVKNALTENYSNKNTNIKKLDYDMDGTTNDRNNNKKLYKTLRGVKKGTIKSDNIEKAINNITNQRNQIIVPLINQRNQSVMDHLKSEKIERCKIDKSEKGCEELLNSIQIPTPEEETENMTNYNLVPADNLSGNPNKMYAPY